MKLLLFSDLHVNPETARRIVERARLVDVMVGAGDFASVRRGLRTCIDVLRASDKPAVLVAGNNESTEELAAACQGWPQAHVLHGSGVSIAGHEFFGLGGGVPVTPFGAWSYDFTEDQAATLLQPAPAGCVLVSHSPPQGTVDRDGSGRSLGSVAVREAITRLGPRLVVCGHIHASAGQHAMVGRTPVVNAGPYGVTWELAEEPT
ncbi:MAG: metallophosphoesterase family protein [Isosphaeraceae bacterium]|nr:metallophosphoesterase family protein [Isosphaeraceae bacterium]